MERFTVTFCDTAAAAKPTVVIPFSPQALVGAFAEKIFNRAPRHNIIVTPETHTLTLRLKTQTGAVLDTEDVISDVVLHPETESIYAIFTAIPGTTALFSRPAEPATPRTPFPVPVTGDTIEIRLVTADAAKQDRGSISTFAIACNATIHELHERAAHHLELPAHFGDRKIRNECNCAFAQKLSDCPPPATGFYVIYDKSNVCKLDTATNSKSSLDTALQARFGTGLEACKKAHYFGGEPATAGSEYIKMPVVSICSRGRHIPIHARSTDLPDDTNEARSYVLDLHTAEMPIDTACMPSTLQDAGLLGLCENGVLELYSVVRASSSTSNLVGLGKEAIFRARSHFDGPVRQGSRGIAMFLATVRVVAALLEDMTEDDAAHYDAILHVFDLLFNFPPALRAIHILSKGQTAGAVECAAPEPLSIHHASSFHANRAGTDRTRLFEGTRLLFGFIFEKARTSKLVPLEGAAEGEPFPYISAFSQHGLRDARTNEPIMYPVAIENGLVERGYVEAFAQGGLLEDTASQPYLRGKDVEPDILRAAICSGGNCPTVTVFSPKALRSNYRYADGGCADSIIDASELNELECLAEMCGRNKLAVHQPNQLRSAVSPCLTFDRNAHLAVYTGEQSCGEPGASSLIFRPTYGTETIDPAVVEQLIAPILKSYEASGTAVFDVYGGALLKQLQAPDEIIMFCVDCSASMSEATDFAEVNESQDTLAGDVSQQAVVEGHYYGKASLEDAKEGLSKLASFEDMIAIVKAATDGRRRHIARTVLLLLCKDLADRVSVKQEEFDGMTERATSWYSAQRGTAQLKSEIDRYKTFFGGLKTHEEGLVDFMLYRATRTTGFQRWTWSVGDQLPSVGRARFIPNLPEEITEIPHELRCSITQDLIEDPVRAADGHSYSREALKQWFSGRLSSPLHGTALQDSTVTPDDGTCLAASQWMEGAGIITCSNDPSSRPLKKRSICLSLDGNLGSFERTIPADLSVQDLYKLVFRGFKARFTVFQLALENGNRTLFPSSEPISSLGLKNGDAVTVRIANEEDLISTSNAQRPPPERVLIKVYLNKDFMNFAFWIDRYTSNDVSTIIWKWRRHTFETTAELCDDDMQVWTEVKDHGDGRLVGEPCEDSETKLSSFFNRTICVGSLQHEGLCVNHHVEDVDAPLVLKIQLSDPWDEKKRVKLSRLDVLKQMFEATINRLQGYGFNSHIGLITFASKAEVRMPISHVIENFRRATNEMQAGGDTALWDAIALARDKLKDYGYEGKKKRIVVISDGNDSNSVTNTAEGIAWKLMYDGIALDSISLGNVSNRSLKAVSYSLGCYQFHPESLANALAICELEPYLSVTERDDIKAPAGASNSRLIFGLYFSNYDRSASYTKVSSSILPKRKDHPNINDSVVALAAATQLARSATLSGTARSTLRIGRLMSEMRAIAAGPLRETYDVYVSETDMSFWKVVMSGPSDSPYADGTFLLYIHAEERYPAFAPKARFITRVLHPNINAHGRICHSILDRDWTSDTSMTTLLDTIYGLLMQPEFSDPVSTTATLGYHHNGVQFSDEAREITAQHASKSRAEWKEELLGE